MAAIKYHEISKSKPRGVIIINKHTRNGFNFDSSNIHYSRCRPDTFNSTYMEQWISV